MTEEYVVGEVLRQLPIRTNQIKITKFLIRVTMEQKFLVQRQIFVPYSGHCLKCIRSLYIRYSQEFLFVFLGSRV